ncbi:MAG: TPM domain-containing protein, partial [Bacteroidota bacterium]|nr:TPM domain-containing protein [Bacteroidota bacterium]
MSFFSKNLLTKEEMKLVSDTIAEAEKKTIGEIRVSIRKARRFKERKLSIYDLAVKNFHELGMANTKDHTGVLIYLLMSD